MHMVRTFCRWCSARGSCSFLTDGRDLVHTARLPLQREQRGPHVQRGNWQPGCLWIKHLFHRGWWPDLRGAASHVFPLVGLGGGACGSLLIVHAAACSYSCDQRLFCPFLCRFLAPVSFSVSISHTHPPHSLSVLHACLFRAGPFSFPMGPPVKGS